MLLTFAVLYWLLCGHFMMCKFEIAKPEYGSEDMSDLQPHSRMDNDNYSQPGAPIGGKFVVDTEQSHSAPPVLIIPGKKGQLGGGYASS